MMPQTRKEDPGGEGGNSTGTCSIDLVVSIMPQTREEDPGGEGGHHQQGQQDPCTTSREMSCVQLSLIIGETRNWLHPVLRSWRWLWLHQKKVKNKNILLKLSKPQAKLIKRD